MNKYARGYAFTLDDMFISFRHKKLKITCDECEQYFKERHKSIVAQRIMRECVKMVMEDVLENNITFKLPGCNSEIHMERISGEDFKIARSRGAFPDIDFLKTNCTVYRPYLYMYGNRVRKKPIKSHKSYTKKLDEYINNGKIYC